MQVDCDGLILDAIFFSTTPRAAGLRSGMRLDLACYPQVNQFRGLAARCSCSSPTSARPVTGHGGLAHLPALPSRGNAEQSGAAAAAAPAAGFCSHLALSGALRWEGDADRNSPWALSNRIARTFGLPCGCSRTLICLDVLQERGLIDLAAEPEVLRITLRQVEQKVDLDDSSILRQLRQLLQDS